MSYSTDPVADAAAYVEALYSREDRIQAETKNAKAEIHAVFQAVRRMPAKALALPAVDSQGTRVIRVSLPDVVSDRIAYGRPLRALITALEESDCPHVAALRKVLADDYADSHADEIGMAMEGDE